jgi:AcrR family transcriptional regulator
VQAAAAVFAENGYDGTRVQEIAKRAGLTTGAIYANFDGKADLLLEAIDTLGAHELDRLLFSAVSGRSTTEVLVALGVELMSKSEPPGDGTLLFEALGAARRDPDVARRLQIHFRERAERVAQLLRDGQRNGEIDPAIDVDAGVRFCLSLALGFLACDILEVAPVGPTGWEQLIRRVAAAFAASPSPSPSLSLSPRPRPRPRPAPARFDDTELTDKETS